MSHEQQTQSPPEEMCRQTPFPPQVRHGAGLEGPLPALVGGVYERLPLQFLRGLAHRARGRQTNPQKFQIMKRQQYNQNRAELDQEAYRDGFLNGYQSGADAAIEFLYCDEFTYAEHCDPVRRDTPFDEEPSRPEQKLAYQIGYSDAFDRGYQSTLKSVDQAFREIKGISIVEGLPPSEEAS
jgi:hypothetical protein